MGYKIYDVSLTVHPGIPVYPGDPAVQREVYKTIEGGDPYNISAVNLQGHTGTHVDAPLHFIANAQSVDRILPEVLVGEVRLVQLPAAERIDRSTLERLDLQGVKRLIIGCRNSELLTKNSFDPDYAYITGDAAQYMVELGIILVGLDYLSVDDFHSEKQPAHHILLGAGVIIVEGLYLTGVPADDYEMMCLPVKIEGGDGAPARVFLRELK